MDRLRVIFLTVLCWLLAPLLLLGQALCALVGNKDRARRVALGVDQSFNALLGGSEDETMSSRIGRGARDGEGLALTLAPVVDALFGKNHCAESIERIEHD
jgi:hypothetical protein